MNKSGLINFFTLFSFLFFFTHLLSAQTNSLRGKITDSASGKPLAGAVVFISDNYSAVSNSEGHYRLNGLRPGSFTVRVSHIGYAAAARALNVTDGEQIRFDFSLEASAIPLDEIIVSSNRYDQSLRNSPYSETAVSTSELKGRTFLSVSDALQNQQGISMLRDGIWGTEISIRGLSRENVVTLIDGNRIATSTDIAARLSMIDLNDIERIEVIRGAASSMYGSGATGGIVNIISKAPQYFETFSLNGNVSSGFNTVNNASLWSGALYSGGSFWSSKILGSYRKAKNTHTPSGELKNSMFEDYSFSGAINIMPYENNTFKLNYQLFKATDVGIPGASVFPDNADVRYPDEKRAMYSAAYEIQNITKYFYKLSAKYSYQEISRNVENIPHTVQNIPANGTQPAKRVSVLKITPAAEHLNNNAQIQANFLLAEDHTVVLGIDYWDRKYSGERQKYQLIEVLNAQGAVTSTTNKVIGENPLPDCDYHSLGVYAQHNGIIIRDALSLSLGARADKISVSGEGAMNPLYEIVNGVKNTAPAGQKAIWKQVKSDDVSYSGNAGIKYSLTTALDLTLSLGISFRSPSLEERFQYIDQGSFVRVGKADLNPEKGKSADFGIRYYSPAFKLVSSFFFNSFNNLVAEIPGTFEGRNAYIKTNIGEARLSGFDLRADYNFWRDAVVYATASYVKGEDLTAKAPLADMPPLNGNIGIRANIAGYGEADFSATLFARQDRVAAGELTTPGYATLNFYAGTQQYRFGGISLALSAGLENILNKEYRNHLSTGRGLIKNEPGRNLFLKVNIQW